MHGCYRVRDIKVKSSPSDVARASCPRALGVHVLLASSFPIKRLGFILARERDARATSDGHSFHFYVAHPSSKSPLQKWRPRASVIHGSRRREPFVWNPTSLSLSKPLLPDSIVCRGAGFTAASSCWFRWGPGSMSSI